MFYKTTLDAADFSLPAHTSLFIVCTVDLNANAADAGGDMEAQVLHRDERNAIL